MIKGIERNSIHMSKTKKQMSEIKHKELTDEDKIRLQLIDDAISRIKTMPQIGLDRSETIGETIDDTSKACGINVASKPTNSVGGINAKENPTQTGNEIIQVTPEQLILTEQKITKNSIDFVNLHTDPIIRGVKTFLQPIIAGKIIKQGGTSNQILLANGDTIEKDQLDYDPIENARFSSIAYGMYESRIWGTVTTQNSR
ncbi:MAG: hypothetical protein EZS28_041359, partial [Streblomastix strix]